MVSAMTINDIYLLKNSLVLLNWGNLFVSKKNKLLIPPFQCKCLKSNVWICICMCVYVYIYMHIYGYFYVCIYY